jgi:hypothetical protein
VCVNIYSHTHTHTHTNIHIYTCLFVCMGYNNRVRVNVVGANNPMVCGALAGDFK